MSLASLIIESLTDEHVTVDQLGAQDIVNQLVELGWDAERLQAARDASLASGQRWPRFIPAARRGEVGAAQLNAATAEVLQLMGVGPHSRVRQAGEPDARDRALMADRPPHHGTVG